MKIGRVLLVLVLVMVVIIVFGNRGLRDNYAMREKLLDLKKSNAELRRQNEELRKLAALLKDDLPTIEAVARNELGLVKKGDIVYRIVQ